MMQALMIFEQPRTLGYIISAVLVSSHLQFLFLRTLESRKLILYP